MQRRLEDEVTREGIRLANREHSTGRCQPVEGQEKRSRPTVVIEPTWITAGHSGMTVHGFLALGGPRKDPSLRQVVGPEVGRSAPASQNEAAPPPGAHKPGLAHFTLPASRLGQFRSSPVGRPVDSLFLNVFFNNFSLHIQHAITKETYTNAHLVAMSLLWILKAYSGATLSSRYSVTSRNLQLRRRFRLRRRNWWT